MLKNNTMTRKAVEEIEFVDPYAWEDDLLDDTEYAMELDKRKPILEGIIETLNKRGLIISENDQKQIIKELNRRYRLMGIDEGVPRSVKEWVKGEKCNTSPAYRKNIYDLCIALEMNIEETTSFFLKKAMTIPFNYKNRVDAVYYYGISHGKSYTEIRDLLCKIDEENSAYNSREDKTMEICAAISEIDDDEVFIKYLRSHTYDKETHFSTIRNEIMELLNRIVQIFDNNDQSPLSSNQERKKSFVRKDGEINIKALLDTIYNYSNQENYHYKDMNISKSTNLPEAFKKNFPNDQELSRIKNATASDDVYRKAYIIMKLFEFFLDEYCKEKSNEKDLDSIEQDFEDFCETTSLGLEKCGFVQLYPRNPFDWLILYCVKSSSPIETFQELLHVRYLEEDE